jgi:hypothetical protein
MRILTAVVYVVLAACLLSCDQQQPIANIDPQLGLDCFESQRASLPPGTQYEGIDKLADNSVTIKIMDGVEIVKLDCALSP